MTPVRKIGTKGQASYEEILDQERLILGATEMILGIMESEGVTRSELATRISRSRGYISQLLSGERNLTLRTLAGIAHSLGYQVVVDVRPLPGAPKAAVRQRVTPGSHPYRPQHVGSRMTERRPVLRSACDNPLVAA